MSKYAVRLSDDKKHRGVLVRLIGRELHERRPLNLSLVLDVSGSMSRQASMPSSNGVAENYAFQLLDVVKHACKAICQQMSETDVLSLVVFSTNASIAFAARRMTGEAKENFISTLNKIDTCGETNLFDGIRLGVETLHIASDMAHADALNQVITLTDGEPTRYPVTGNESAVKQLALKYENFKFTLNMLALGFNEMKSQELATLAQIGNQGGFTYIPDMGMVGSVFVNLVSTIFSTVEQNISVTVNDNSSQQPTTVVVPLLQSGQTVDVWIPVNRVESVDVCVGLPEDALISIDLTDDDVARAHANDELIKSLALEANRSVEPKSDNFDFPSWCKKELVSSLPVYVDMMSEGRKALQKQYFVKWGRHYLQSLYSAHTRKVCNNFKDKGVQSYATEFFLRCQAEGDKAFNTLPAPTSSCINGKTVHNSSQLNNNNNPCVHGNSLVLMADGSTKMAQNIVKGDVVRTENVTVDGSIVNTATIQCVLKTKCENNMMHMCKLPSGLIVTPYHPVATTMPCCFQLPYNIIQPVLVPCDAVYSFLLLPTDQGKAMIIDNTFVVVLGNELSDGVANHLFFSSRSAITCALNQCKGWANGYITFNFGPITRDPKTTLANGFNYAREIV